MNGEPSKLAISRAAVDLAAAGHPVTIESVTRISGASVGEFDVLFVSMDAVWAEVADLYRRSFAMTEPTRRRSTTHALTEGLTAWWSEVMAHQDAYRVLTLLRLSHPHLRVGDARLKEVPFRCAQQWLTQVSVTQRITWTTPLPVLARFVVTTLDGLMIGHLSGGDLPRRSITDLLQLFAFQLSAHSTRNPPPGHTRRAQG